MKDPNQQYAKPTYEDFAEERRQILAQATGSLAAESAALLDLEALTSANPRWENVRIQDVAHNMGQSF